MLQPITRRCSPLCLYSRPFHHTSQHCPTSHFLFLDIIPFIFTSLNYRSSGIHRNRSHFQRCQINNTTLDPCRSVPHALSILVPTTCGFPQSVAPNTSPIGRESKRLFPQFKVDSVKQTVDIEVGSHCPTTFIHVELLHFQSAK